MIFESRELKPRASFVPVSALQEGSVYFHVYYFDDNMLVPVMEPLVFIGRNLETEDVDRTYFQDLDSYREGVRYSDPPVETPSGTKEMPFFQIFSEKNGQVSSVYEFESAREDLMRCSLRRRENDKPAK